MSIIIMATATANSSSFEVLFTWTDKFQSRSKSAANDVLQKGVIGLRESVGDIQNHYRKVLHKFCCSQLDGVWKTSILHFGGLCDTLHTLLSSLSRCKKCTCTSPKTLCESSIAAPFNMDFCAWVKLLVLHKITLVMRVGRA